MLSEHPPLHPLPSREGKQLSRIDFKLCLPRRSRVSEAETLNLEPCAPRRSRQGEGGNLKPIIYTVQSRA